MQKANHAKNTDATLAPKDSTNLLSADTIENETGDDNETATYFVVIADTSLDYENLRREMFSLNMQLGIPIDTMGRYFNKKKNLIALPDDDEDEIYAGEYYPRRFPSENLSIEYLNFYQQPSQSKAMALVTGIYESLQSADSALAVQIKVYPKSFKISSQIYTGCMH